MRHAIHSLFKAGVEAITTPLKDTQFDRKGVLTPDEFIAAGEYLVHACPTWSWEAGDPKKKRAFLPADRQYLVTRNVPCLRRAKDLEYDPQSEFALAGEEDGWVATHRDPTVGAEHVPNIEDDAKIKPAVKDKEDDDDIPDISELELQAEDDEAALPSEAAARKQRRDEAVAGGSPYITVEEPEETILRTRTYDLYITYDQYYQVPRLWLVGFDETRHPLLPDQVLEDVSEEHARKTITVEGHPNLSLSAASIHPCRHGETMKRLVDNIIENGGAFQIEHYLVLFLKFIASVVPTIQYDYTMSV